MNAIKQETDVAAMVASLRQFLREVVLPLEESEGLTWATPAAKDLRATVRRAAVSRGLYAPDMPPEAGGLGLSFRARCELEMELHAHDTVFFEDVLGGAGGPSSILLKCDPGQRVRYLEPLMTGEATACFALSEADAGSDASALKTRAVPTSTGYRLEGSKSIVTNAGQADFAIVFARVVASDGEPAGITAFLVDASAPGYRVARDHTCMGFTGFQSELAFEGVPLSAENVLGDVGRGFGLALAWITPNRVRTAAMATGIARRLLDRSVSFAVQRSQFGAPIASFQAIQLKLANMATELYAAEAIVRRTADLIDSGRDVRAEASMTKLFCSEMVNRHAYEAIQVHGGAGCLAETGIERAYRMVRILTILEGTSEMQQLAVADSLLGAKARRP